jgi:hypothetical protein
MIGITGYSDAKVFIDHQLAADEDWQCHNSMTCLSGFEPGSWKRNGHWSRPGAAMQLAHYEASWTRSIVQGFPFKMALSARFDDIKSATLYTYTFCHYSQVRR